MAVLDVEVFEIVGHEEEHVLLLVQSLEAARIVWKFVKWVGGAGVAEEDALLQNAASDMNSFRRNGGGSEGDIE